jgi:HlyD family secretion protein
VSAALVAALVGIYWRLKTAGDESGNVSSAAEIGSVPSAEAFSTNVAVQVTGVPVVRDTFVLYVHATGEAEAARAATLPAEVAGSVVDVRVREGGAVQAGQVLVRLDPARFRLAVRQAEAALAKAQARFAELTVFHDEIPDAAVRTKRARMARVQSGLVDAEIALEQARLDLERATIRAPFDGRVADLAVLPGQRVAIGDSVCAVVDLSSFRVVVQALEGEVVQVAPGREATVAFSALPDTGYIGRVATINPVIDPRTRAGRVTVTLDNPDGRIRPGMYARVRIAARLHADRVMVPREAILERDRRKLVFLFEPAAPESDVGLAKWTYVTTGLENDEHVEIVPSGQTAVLEPGQIVLVEGHATLVHDAKVRLVKG